MTMDFLKRPAVSDIVDKNYIDLQSQRSSEWIKNYKGSNILQDWLEFVPFDVTPENRKVYNDTYEALSGLSSEDFNNFRITEITTQLEAAPTPLERLYVLQGANDKENEAVADYFMPKLTQLQEYFSTDMAHKSAISHEKGLEEALAKLFTPGTVLDALVPESVHIKDIQTIERLNKLGIASIVNGRVTVKDGEGNDVVGSNLKPEENSPDAAEQYAVQVNSYSPIKRAVRPHLNIAKNVTAESKRQADESLFKSIPTLSMDDIPPVIANMLDYSDKNITETVRGGIKSYIESSQIQDKTRGTARLTGQLLSTIYKRSTLQ